MAGIHEVYVCIRHFVDKIICQRDTLCLEGTNCVTLGRTVKKMLCNKHGKVIRLPAANSRYFNQDDISHLCCFHVWMLLICIVFLFHSKQIKLSWLTRIDEKRTVHKQTSKDTMLSFSVIHSNNYVLR